MTRWRRLVRDYEQRIDVSHAMILLAMGGNLIRRNVHPRFSKRTLSGFYFRDSHGTPTSIGFDVGFGDLSHFNRCFRKAFGCSPREFRDALVSKGGAPSGAMRYPT